MPTNPTYKPKADQYQQTAKDARAKARKAAVAKLRTKTDKIEGVTWYSHPNQPKYTNSRSTVYLYIGKRGTSRPWLRMKIQYAARDWLFVDEVEAWFDGTKRTLDRGRFERDNHSTIWEWIDENPTEGQLGLLESIANSKEAILRFHGRQYRKDVTISKSDKRAIRDVLAAFEAM